MTQTITQRHKGPPPELLAIKSPKSINECLQFIEELSDPQNYIDKYKLHLTNKYFQDNILSLSLEQLNQGLSHPYIKNKYSSFETLNRCITNNVAFPILFSCILQKTVSLDTVYKYCHILSHRGKEEDLNTIWQAYEHVEDSVHPIILLFKNTKNPTNTLVEVMIQNDASYILQAKTWSHEKVIDWIHVNKIKSLNIISKASPFVLSELPLVIQHAFYNNAIEHFTSPENIKSQDIQKTERDFLINMPISYIQYLQNSHKDYLNRKLKKNIRIEINKNAYTMNMCQYILCEKKFQSIEGIEQTFSIYKELIRMPIQEQIGLYSHNILAFEYAVKNNKTSFFAPFDLNSNLEAKERDILLAVSFNCLVSHTNAKNKNLSNSWVYDIYDENITHCTDQEFTKYANMLDSMNSNLLSKEVANYRLVRKVNSIPFTNEKQGSKLKI